MARRRSDAPRAAGVVLVIVGAGLGVWGYRVSQSLGNEVAAAISGGATDEVMAFYIAGAATLALGLFLLFRR